MNVHKFLFLKFWEISYNAQGQGWVKKIFVTPIILTRSSWNIVRRCDTFWITGTPALWIYVTPFLPATTRQHFSSFANKDQTGRRNKWTKYINKQKGKF